MNTVKLLACLLLLFNIIILCRADDAQEITLGHHQKEEGLVKKAGVIFIGHFNSLGNGPGGDSASMEYFDGAEVEIGQLLKGSLSGKLVVSYSVENTKKNARIIQKSKRITSSLSTSSAPLN